MALSSGVIGALVIVVLAAGALTGIAGFGFAMLGTMLLASLIDPSTAVVFMIIPILAVNISLIRDLSVEEIRTCGRRFAPLLITGVIGTIIGLVVLERLPPAPLKMALGLLALSFVASSQQVLEIPGLARAKEGCFVENTPAMIGLGGIFGVVFGGTNVGVQFIAYIRSCDLSHGVFIGVVAMVFLGLNGIRVLTAGVVGLYPDGTMLLFSIAAAVPAVGGVAIGRRMRSHVRTSLRRFMVLGLLVLIGIRLVLSGAGVV